MKHFTCEDELSYSETYDAYFCETCDIWFESECPDRECYYCSNRPDRPSEVKENGTV